MDSTDCFEQGKKIHLTSTKTPLEGSVENHTPRVSPGKPVVFYRRYVGGRGVGYPAVLDGVKNHPNKNLKGEYVITSPVVIVREHGEFETDNTIYFPEDYNN